MGESRDTRQRFGVRFKSDESIDLNCFNCKFGATWQPGTNLSKKFEMFLTAVGISADDLKKIKFQAFVEKEDKLRVVDKQSLKVETWSEIELPKDSLPLSTWDSFGCTESWFVKVRNYCLSRQLTNFDELYWSPLDTAKDKLIIPGFFNRKIVSFQTRSLIAQKGRKYIYHGPSSFVFNLDSQTYSRKYVIVVEGALDAYSVSGVAVLGKKINDQRATIINQLGKIPVVLADREKTSSSLVDEALARNWAVSFPNWSRQVKDANEAVCKYGKLFTIKSIIDNIEYNPVAIKLKDSMVWK